MSHSGGIYGDRNFSGMQAGASADGGGTCQVLSDEMENAHKKQKVSQSGSAVAKSALRTATTPTTTTTAMTATPSITLIKWLPALMPADTNTGTHMHSQRLT